MNQKQSSSWNLGSNWMTQGLIFSVALNIALITSLVFNVVKSKESGFKPVRKIEKMRPISKASSLEDILKTEMGKNYLELLSDLADRSHVEEGFCIRDIAASILAHHYDVDLERALLGQEVNTRMIPIKRQDGSVYDYPLLSGLTDSEYKLLNTFLENERWPQTSQGLFKKLAAGGIDETLRSAFYLSKEFMYIEALFCSLSIPKETLLSILLQGSWEMLQEFSHDYHGVQDFSNPLRIRFLSQYLDFGSEDAAKLILEIDAEYALKKFSDNQIVSLISLLDHKTQLAENLALHLALGKRSDWVRREACRLLYHYSGKELPEPYSYQVALNFISQKYQIDPIETFANAIEQAPEEEYVPKSSSHKIYIVQEKDNLWKIAKKHNVNLDDLKATNHLESDLIKVGMTLIIP